MYQGLSVTVAALSVDRVQAERDTGQETPMKTLQLLRAPLGMVRAL